MFELVKWRAWGWYNAKRMAWWTARGLKLGGLGSEGEGHALYAPVCARKKCD